VSRLNFRLWLNFPIRPFPTTNKGKEVGRHVGREVVQLHSLLTLTQDGGGWSTSPCASLFPERTQLLIESETGCAPQPVQTILRRRRSLSPEGIRTLDRPVSSQVGIPTSLSLRLFPAGFCTKILYVFVVCTIHYMSLPFHPPLFHHRNILR
jgi:hypothetical protein